MASMDDTISETESSNSFPLVSVADASSWWDRLSTILTSSSLEKVDLEVDNLREWTISSAAEVLSNVDFCTRESVVTYISEAEIGIRVLLVSMEENSAVLTHNSEANSRMLREIVNPKNGKLRSTIIKQAISVNYLPICIKILKDLSYSRSRSKLQEDSESVESIIINILWFVSAVASNDSSFASKVRQMLKVKFFHHDLYKKLFFGNSSAHYPLLKIFRQLSKNENASKTLGKDGIMSSIRKSITVLSNTPGNKLLILMDILSHLTKYKANCVRFLKAGLGVKLMRCFASWDLWRGKGLLKLSKFIIAIYSHVGQTKSGRKALTQCDAILQFRKFCDTCPMERAFDDVIMKCTAMISICYGKDKLPIANIESPIVFKIPDAVSLCSLQDSGSSSDDEGSESEQGSEADSSGEGEAEVSSDEESSISDDEPDPNCVEGFRTPKKFPSLKRPSRTSTHEGPPTKVNSVESLMNVDCLLKYTQLFREFENRGNHSINTRILRPTLSPMSTTLNTLFDENLNEIRKIKGIPQSEHKYTWFAENEECKYWGSINELRRQYAIISNAINHVAPFVKIAYPEFAFAYSYKMSENMLPTTDRTVLRNKISLYIQRIVGGDSYKPKVVYCLDDLLRKKEVDETELKNLDEKQIGKYEFRNGLQFEARFESGNLREAIQIGDREYDLLITSDVNSRHHNQWFYFQVSNTQSDKMYTFNIINCTKGNSLFNYGMQPVVFSVTEALKGRPGWIRAGSEICYFKNGYKCVSKKRHCAKVYHTLSFSLTFSHKGDIVYIAYHIPYTYSRLMVELNALIKAAKDKPDLVVNYDSLCNSINKNEVPLLTITSRLSESSDDNRQIIFLTSRVHPGETNASWVMKGILEYLLFGKGSDELLKKFIFKIVPMLNVEGVINGCHRCGLTSEDLNRCWKSPSEILHPTIYYTKMLIEYSCKVLKLPPIVYCDLHGHSRRKNLFFYGCLLSKSWSQKDKLIESDPQIARTLPENMDSVSSAFCLAYCNYDVKKNRETTARVAVWRDYKIPRSYTLECSYCGCDRGPYKGIAFGTNHMLEMGMDLCKSFLYL